MRGEKRLPTLHQEPVGGWISGGLWIGVWLDFLYFKRGFFFFFFFHLITFEHSFLPNSCWSSVGKILGNLILRKKKKH